MGYPRCRKPPFLLRSCQVPLSATAAGPPGRRQQRTGRWRSGRRMVGFTHTDGRWRVGSVTGEGKLGFDVRIILDDTFYGL